MARNTMKFLWISGWAIPPAWLAKQARVVWPDCEHVAVTPFDASRALASESYEALGGYSLGALWLLQNTALVPKTTPVILLAPCFAFPAESGGGGRIALTQVRVQRRRLRQDAPAAVADFMRRAGLEERLIPLITKALTPPRIAELDTELGWLETWRSPSPPPDGWQGYVGDQDPLLDTAVLQELWPALDVIEGANHTPKPLLQAARHGGHPSLPALIRKSSAGGPGATPVAEAEIIRSFDRAADGYDVHSAPQEQLGAALAQWIAPEERRGHAVEFGAGTGAFTRHMLPWAGTYLATDAAPRMVALGRERCPGATWKVARADAADLGPVDWLFSCNVLHWMVEPAAILHRWRALLAPGGHLALTVFLGGTLRELQLLLPEAAALRWRSVAEWQALLTQSGFVIERSEVSEHTATYASAHALLRAVHAMGLSPHPTVGPGRLRAALREYDRRFASDGGVRATWQGWLVRAVAV